MYSLPIDDQLSMNKPVFMNRLPISAGKAYSPNAHNHQRRGGAASLYSPKLSILLLATCVSLFILFHIQSLQTSPPSPSPTNYNSWDFMQQWPDAIINTTHAFGGDCTRELAAMATKLRRAVTFLPLKDLRYAQSAQQGHTWFMSSMFDKQEEGEVQHQHFPSEASNGRLLCIKGHDTHDGAWNTYALAWLETLPANATLMSGLTFVSYNHYNYDNIWHGLSAMVPFVAWHIKNRCSSLPARWLLYHWGELRTEMSPWLRSLMDATFDGSVDTENFADGDEERPACFEEAVVMRHNEGGMSRRRRLEVYDLMRCKARAYCNVSAAEGGGIGVTMFMRTGPRSFRNDSAVIGIFDGECRKVEGCRLTVAYSNNLTFCEQVKLMSSTDVLVSPHGAQMTNMFLMERNSSVMEFFPKGWLRLAGVGQYVHHWLASWSGMKHEGAWRDPNGDPCPYGVDDRRCMSVYKSGRIGHNKTFFAQWARNVLNQVRMRKLEEASTNSQVAASAGGCACG
ncbi:uncharacterized protein LOC127801913 [Diospyros lotus]|uniref:uncharacterized protein LOC127801913 n=1 Tax=Diospyros lotus TaxID=55363 RepID=UPI0022583F6C|nr:uncharacterized protein LOC127801913 [Diospyros lotus]